MHLRRTLFCTLATCCFAFLVAAPSAFAEPTSAPSIGTGSTCPHDPADWAIGASLSFVGGLAGVGGIGGLTGLDALGLGGSDVEPGLVLERRLSDHWWLTFGVAASYEASEMLDARSHAVAGSLGARFVVDPDARVRIAPTATVSARTATTSLTNDGDGTTELSSDAIGLGADLGLDVELAVVDGFALRLAVTLAALSYADTTVQNDAGRSTNGRFSAALAARPTLAALFRF